MKRIISGIFIILFALVSMACQSPLAPDQGGEGPAKTEDLLPPQGREMPMYNLAHVAGPRVEQCGLGRVCNKVRRNDSL